MQNFDDEGLDQLESQLPVEQIGWHLLGNVRSLRSLIRRDTAVADAVAALPSDASRRDINVAIYRVIAAHSRSELDNVQRRLEAALTRNQAVTLRVAIERRPAPPAPPAPEPEPEPPAERVPVEQLGLSLRAVNCLRYANICFVDQLIRKREIDLAKIKNLGRRTRHEIKEVLAEHSLSLVEVFPGKQ